MRQHGAPGARVADLLSGHHRDHVVRCWILRREVPVVGHQVVQGAVEPYRVYAVQHLVLARDQQLGPGGRIGQVQNPGLGYLGVAAGNHQLVALGGQVNTGPEPRVVLLVQQLGFPTQIQRPQLVRTPGVVGHHVENPLARRIEGQPVGDILDDVVQLRSGGQVAHAQRESLIAGGVDGVGQQGAVLAHRQPTQGEERGALGFPIGVENDFLAVQGHAALDDRGSPVGFGVAGVGGGHPAVDRVLLALFGAGEVPPAVAAGGHGEIGLHGVRLDLRENGLAQRLLVGGE